MTVNVNRTFRELRSLKGKIPKNTYQSIKGQILSGNVEGANIGIYRIKRELAKEAAGYENSGRK